MHKPTTDAAAHADPAALPTPEALAERVAPDDGTASRLVTQALLAEAVYADREAIAARVRLIVEEYAEGQRNDLGNMLDALYADLRGGK